MKKFILPTFTNLFALLAFLSIAYSAYLALAYANQPLLDVYEFRQTQTALTAYWFAQDGFKLAYETPIGGAPWSIPFEFPIYQYLAAIASKVLDAPLDATGRILSYLFLIFCLIPIRSIIRKIQLSNNIFFIFSAILFSSPMYVYWGRSFLIETAALFLTIVSIKYLVDAIVDGITLKNISLFIVFISISILQKATTGLPVLVVAVVVLFYSEIKNHQSIRAFVFGRSLLMLLTCVTIPLAIGVAWVDFTDEIKSLNPLGINLISSSLISWNWGTLDQRISVELYSHVLWERMFVQNVGGIIWVFLILFSLFVKSEYDFKIIVLLSIIFGITPLFIFTNLHIVHEYYQVANNIFIVFAVAVSVGTVFQSKFGNMATSITLILILVSNYVALSDGYLLYMKKVFTKQHRDVAIGDILRRELPKDKQFVAFGHDWNPTFAYIAQRKSLTAPVWFSKYDEAKLKPEYFVDKDQLGGFVACSIDSPNISEMLFWSSNQRRWKIGTTHDCLIATPEMSFNDERARQVQCLGRIEQAEIMNFNGQSLIMFSGWSTYSGNSKEVADLIFIRLLPKTGVPVYLETLRIPALNVNSYLGISDSFDSGFSRIMLADFPPGEYYASIAQIKGGQYEICQIGARIVVSE